MCASVGVPCTYWTSVHVLEDAGGSGEALLHVPDLDVYPGREVPRGVLDAR